MKAAALAALSLVACGAAGLPAAAQEGGPFLVPTPHLLALIAPETEICAEDGGEIDVEPTAFERHVDFNGDGATDLLLGRGALRCTAFSPHFEGGGGGPILALISTGDPEAPWERHAFHGHGHQTTSLPDAFSRKPILLVSHQGLDCGQAGLGFCAGAYFWAEDVEGKGRFFSLRDGLEE